LPAEFPTDHARKTKGFGPGTTPGRCAVGGDFRRVHALEQAWKNFPYIGFEIVFLFCS
jgi:hypothetical protein